MTILHYFLGFPPYRSGGLTKYALDLMIAQVNDKNEVIALWPGKIKNFDASPTIKKQKKIAGIISYELVNPLPVPLDEGINEFDSFTKNTESSVYKEFLASILPDVIHIHTLMGLHREFINVAKEMNIKTVYTSHDYFGICPKVTLYRYGKCCENDLECYNCIQCNSNPLSLKKIKIMQSPIYRRMKNFVLVRQIRKIHRNDFFLNETLPQMPNIDQNNAQKQYRNLRKYYISILENIKLIHFNSSVAEQIYKRYINPNTSQILSITHQNIKDNRRNNKWKQTEKLRILYLAPAKPFKGFNVLKEALDELWYEGFRQFELQLFGSAPKQSQYMIVNKNAYDYSELGGIFKNSDVLVAPSVWYETFGFTVLEAISYGVPVIVSNRVGAKDVIGKGGIIVEAENVQELKEAILGLSKDKQIEMRKEIVENLDIKEWEYFVKENYEMYK